MGGSGGPAKKGRRSKRAKAKNGSNRASRPKMGATGPADQKGETAKAGGKKAKPGHPRAASN